MSEKGSSSNIENIRHSLAHLLAASVRALYPEAKNAIGPSIENGFYQDFELSKPISETDLPKIEAKMRELLPVWNKWTKKVITLKDVKKEFGWNRYKIELAKEFAKAKKTLTFYICGGFVDLCKGGHTLPPSKIDPHSFKLDRVAGAYWRGDEKNKQLTRIYGLGFGSKKELDEYIKLRAEAERRDHKKLGPKLELFMFHETSPGMPYWLPKGVVLYNELIHFWREEHSKRGYHEIVSPLLNKKDLYITSGHFDHYWQDMFTSKTEDGEIYGLKAMNCPNAMVVFGSKQRSYKDLPLRFSDTDTLHRHELSGTLNGLLRVREFRQDDAHCFITEDQIDEEYRRIFEIVDRFYSVFGLSYRFRLGTRPKSFLGDVKTWNKAEASLKKILNESGKKFSIKKGDGAFYGPKVDILMNDVLGREWQMGTVQLDFQQPRRFKLEYVAADGSRKTPVAVHRVIYGSLERFIGIIIEHFAGAFPLWLSPVQVAILPVSDKFNGYAEKILKTLKENGIRAEVDDNNESLGKKIRNAELQKIPYILVVGEKEENNKTVNVRHYRRGQEGEINSEELIKNIRKEIETKAI